MKRLRECRRDIRRIFEQVDVLVLPTMREPAPLISETVNETHRRPPGNTGGVQPLRHSGVDTAVRVLQQDGLPIGLQIVGPHLARAHRSGGRIMRTSNRPTGTAATPPILR